MEIKKWSESVFCGYAVKIHGKSLDYFLNASPSAIALLPIFIEIRRMDFVL